MVGHRDHFVTLEIGSLDRRYLVPASAGCVGKNPLTDSWVAQAFDNLKATDAI